MLAPLAGATTFEPKSVSKTLNPGESLNEDKLVITEPTPITKADVLFAFDSTGSMYGAISSAGASAISIMDNVKSKCPDTQFGVADYKDYSTYGGGYGDYPWKLDQPITDNEASVQSAVSNVISIVGGGGDGPQDYARVLYESYTDPAIGYRTGVKKILVNFADNTPHDPDPGVDGIISTSDDLTMTGVISGMKAHDITLLEVQNGGAYSSYWTPLATETGGTCYSLGYSDDVTEKITDLITGAVSNIGTLTLKPDDEYKSWVTWTPDKYANVKGSETEHFAVTIKVPDGTKPGTYNFKIHLIGDGAELGAQDVIITVPGTSVPEFPTVAMPVAAVLGLLFVFGRRKE